MEEQLTKLEGLFEDFVTDAKKAAKGNKSAGVRARKAGQEIQATLKSWRKASLLPTK